MPPTRVEGSPKLGAAIRELRSIIKQEDFMTIKFGKDESGQEKILDVSKLIENTIYNGAVQQIGQEVVNQSVRTAASDVPMLLTKHRRHWFGKDGQMTKSDGAPM
jgi:hypothetical protein